MSGWATPQDIRRAADPDEAARAQLWQDQQRSLAAKRTEHLALLAGDEAARHTNFEAWAPLASDGATDEGPRP